MNFRNKTTLELKLIEHAEKFDLLFLTADITYLDDGKIDTHRSVVNFSDNDQLLQTLSVAHFLNKKTFLSINDSSVRFSNMGITNEVELRVAVKAHAIRYNFKVNRVVVAHTVDKEGIVFSRCRVQIRDNKNQLKTLSAPYFLRAKNILEVTPSIRLFKMSTGKTRALDKMEARQLDKMIKGKEEGLLLDMAHTLFEEWLSIK